MASCAHSRTDWLRKASGSLRNTRQRHGEDVLGDRVGADPAGVAHHDRGFDHGGKQHAAHARRRTVHPLQPRRGGEMGRAHFRHERDLRAAESARALRSSLAAWRNGVLRELAAAAARRSESGMFQARKRTVDADEDRERRGHDRKSPLRPPRFSTRRISPIDHLLVDRLDHVVDRQRRDGDGVQRFHLDAGLRRSSARAPRCRSRPRSGRSTTSACESASGWHSGITSDVRFAAMMPASRAVCSGSPFFTAPGPDLPDGLARHGDPPARHGLARRHRLSLTSTIRTSPRASTCDSRDAVARAVRGSAIRFTLCQKERQAFERHRQVHALQLHVRRHLRACRARNSRPP